MLIFSVNNHVDYVVMLTECTSFFYMIEPSDDDMSYKLANAIRMSL